MAVGNKASPRRSRGQAPEAEAVAGAWGRAWGRAAHTAPAGPDAGRTSGEAPGGRPPNALKPKIPSSKLASTSKIKRSSVLLK